MSDNMERIPSEIDLCLFTSITVKKPVSISLLVINPSLSPMRNSVPNAQEEGDIVSSVLAAPPNNCLKWETHSH